MILLFLSISEAHLRHCENWLMCQTNGAADQPTDLLLVEVSINGVGKSDEHEYIYIYVLHI